MKSIFRATAILSTSSLVNILVGLVSAKVMASILQPAGYGYYGLLQNFVGLATLITGMGMATGLVRTGAAAVASDDQATVASLRNGARLLLAGTGVLTLLVIVIFRGPISRWALGTSDQAQIIVLMSIAVLFTAAANIGMGTLNAYHRVKALAKYGIANGLLGATAAILCVSIWHRRGIIPAIIVGAIFTWASATYFVRREVGPVRMKPPRQETFRAASKLLRFGGPYTASALMGTGVQLALPMLVLHLLNADAVGYYRAATAISVNYLGFLVIAMGQDYYPRVSAAKDRPGELVTLINQQHRLVMLLGVPMVLGTLALVPYLVPIVFSSKFMPAADILEWQLIGDLLKFSSWTMSFAILARCGSSVFLLTESIGGVVTIVATWLAVRWFGLSGLGISFVGIYVVYYLVVWLILRREVPLTWTAANKRMLLGALSAALFVRIIPATRFAEMRTIIALALAFGAGIPSLYIVWKELMRDKEREPAAAFAQPVRN